MIKAVRRNGSVERLSISSNALRENADLELVHLLQARQVPQTCMPSPPAKLLLVDYTLGIAVDVYNFLVQNVKMT